jgi:hypothetical protein
LRTSTFVRAGVIVTASALAFGLGAGPVSAAETSSATATAPAAASASVFSAGSTDAAAVPAGPIRLGSGTITSNATTRFVGSGQFAGGGGATATVIVNGRTKGAVAVLFSQSTPGAIAVDIPRGWGSGKVQINVNGTVSNTFYARKQVRSKVTYPLKIRRVNSSVTFRALGVKIVNPRSGKFQSIKKVKLQQLKGGKWKTKKSIRLNSAGNGKYKTSIKKKYRYRIYVPRTSTQEKFSTIKTGKI